MLYVCDACVPADASYFEKSYTEVDNYAEDSDDDDLVPRRTLSAVDKTPVEENKKPLSLSEVRRKLGSTFCACLHAQMITISISANECWWD